MHPDLTPIRWRSATHADRSALQLFTCTDAPKTRGRSWKKTEQPNWWSKEIQGEIRTQRPPLSPPYFMVIGEDEEGIAAAALYSELDGPGNVEVASMAVALRHRGRGGAVADALFQEVLNLIDERAVDKGIASVLVSGRIYGLNVPSQRMAIRAKMRHVDTFDNGVQEWVLEFPSSIIDDRPNGDAPALFEV